MLPEASGKFERPSTRWALRAKLTCPRRHASDLPHALSGPRVALDPSTSRRNAITRASAWAGSILASYAVGKERKCFTMTTIAQPALTGRNGTAKGFREQGLQSRKASTLHPKEQAGSGWRNPLVVAILATTAAAASNAVVAVVNGHLQRDLESQKAEQTRILEMIQNRRRGQSRGQSHFLLKTGLIDEPVLAQKIQKFLADRVQETDLLCPLLPVLSSVETENFVGVERESSKVVNRGWRAKSSSDVGALLRFVDSRRSNVGDED